MCGIVAVLPRYATMADRDDSDTHLPSLIPIPPQAEVGTQRINVLASHLRDTRLAAELLRLPQHQQRLLASNEDRQGILERTARLRLWVDATANEGLVSGDDLPDDASVEAARRDLLDAIWIIEQDIVGSAESASSMAGSDPSPHAAISWLAVERALHSLNLLEVRGRDSAGLTITVSLGPDQQPGSDRVQTKDPFALRNGSRIATQRSVSFAYKHAAIIGSLGDNVRALRESLMSDPDLRAAINLPGARVTVVAHTRWASVGRISEANAHPVSSFGATESEVPRHVVAALNGDVDNYLNLAPRVGFHPDERWVSTDAKVIPLLLAQRLKDGSGIGQALAETLPEFDGSMAIAALDLDNPESIALAVKGSGQGLYVGRSGAGYVVSSEIYGLVGHTQQFIRVGESDAGGGVMELTREGEQDAPPTLTQHPGAAMPLPGDAWNFTDLTTRDLDRRGFEHYLLKEISEAPAAFAKTLTGKIDTKSTSPRVVLPLSALPQSVRDRLKDHEIRQVYIVGQGTAAVACAGIGQVLRLLTRDLVTVTATPASEFSVWELRPDMSDALVIAVSQSGSTTDTNRAVDMARSRGATILSIVNRRESDLATKSHGVLYTSDGRDIEMSVASTKAFYAQAAAGSLLSLQIARCLGALEDPTESAVLRALSRLPVQLSQVAEKASEIEEIASQLATRFKYWSVVGSGPNRVAAEEVRIKASELCYRTISADAIEDKKHIDLSAEALVIVCAAGTPPQQTSDIRKEVAILKAHGNVPVVFVDEAPDEWSSDFVVQLPRSHPYLAWILSTAAGHLFSYGAARSIDASAEPARRALSALEDIIDTGAGEAAGVPRAVQRHIDEVLKAVARGDLDGVLSPSTATSLASLQTNAWATPDVAMDESLFGRVRRVLSVAIEELGRPIDSVKHQAKTVTVGTSREDTDLLDNLVTTAILRSDATGTGLGYQCLRELRTFAGVLAEVTGTTRYAIGEGAVGERWIQVVSKEGSSATIPSRADQRVSLTGNKRRVVDARRPRLVRGIKDERLVLLVPEEEGGEVTGLYLLHVQFANTVGAVELLRAARLEGDRWAELVAQCSELMPNFTESSIATLTPEQALLWPVERVVQLLAASHGSGSAAEA